MLCVFNDCLYYVGIANGRHGVEKGHRRTLFCFPVSPPRFQNTDNRDFLFLVFGWSIWIMMTSYSKQPTSVVITWASALKRTTNWPYPMKTWVISPTTKGIYPSTSQPCWGIRGLTCDTSYEVRVAVNCTDPGANGPFTTAPWNHWRDRDGLTMLHFSGPTPKSPGWEEGNSHKISGFQVHLVKFILDNIQYTRFHGCSVVITWLITQIITQIKTLEIHDDFGDVWRSERFLHLGS